MLRVLASASRMAAQAAPLRPTVTATQRSLWGGTVQKPEDLPDHIKEQMGPGVLEAMPTAHEIEHGKPQPDKGPNVVKVYLKPSLEWCLSSPPPLHQFEEQPIIVEIDHLKPAGEA